MDFLTPEIFDALVFAVIIVGVALAALRLYRDFTRPLPDADDDFAEFEDDDTREHNP